MANQGELGHGVLTAKKDKMETELVITFAQQMTYWFSLTMANWISIVVAAITFGLLVAAMIQWGSNRKAIKQSHKPMIRSDFRMPNESNAGYVKLKNVGLGPVLLEDINIYVEGEKLVGCISDAASEAVQIIAKAARGNVYITEIQDFQSSYPISSNESQAMIAFNLIGMKSYPRFEDEIRKMRVQVEVIYKDIFGKQHRAIAPQPGKEL